MIAEQSITAELRHYEYLDKDYAASGARFYGLEFLDRSGRTTSFGPIEVSFDASPGLRWLPSSPNPFRDKTDLLLNLPAGGELSVKVYDVRGRQIRTIFEGIRGPGVASFQWDALDQSGGTVGVGTYFVRARHRDQTTETRIVKIP